MFRYEAADSQGKVLRGAMDAGSAQEVRARLEGRGFRGVQVLTSAVAAVAPASVQGYRPAAPAAARALFFRQLASMATAGFTPSSALTDLGPRTSHTGLREAAQRMAQATGRGGSLAGAMAAEAGLFPEHTVGVVAAAEQGGFLPFAFEEAALDAEHDLALRRGLWWAKFLSWQAVWSVLLMAPLFPSIDPENLTASAVRYGRALLLIVLPLGVGMHLVAIALGRWWMTPAAAGFRDRLCLRAPVMARLARARALAAFTRVLRRLLAAGVSPESAYAAAAQAAPNGLLRERLLEGLPALRQGGGLDAAIRRSGLMDHDPLQLLITGQQTGTWNETLDQVAAFYQEEAARATDAARNFQKRLGVILTLVTTGYVTIAATAGGVGLMNKTLRLFDGP